MLVPEYANLAESYEVRDQVRCNLLFSHVHWDHIQGFPFFGQRLIHRLN